MKSFFKLDDPNLKGTPNIPGCSIAGYNHPKMASAFCPVRDESCMQIEIRTNVILIGASCIKKKYYGHFTLKQPIRVSYEQMIYRNKNIYR